MLKTKVLITVMTYPHPSAKHEELVCTAGITEGGEWVRLYPVNYRYRPTQQQFKKYQWILVELQDRGSGNDNRKESRKPVLETIQLLGRPLTTDYGWREREEIIGKLPVQTVSELQGLYERDKTSLGIVRPSKVLDLKIEPAQELWKPEWQNQFDQLRLFGTPPKPLKKIPFKFSYIFECEDHSKPHTAMIEDWELGVLYLKEEARLQSPEKAAQSVRRKYLGELCAADRDVRFFMGTVFPYNSWVVVGVYWPPKINQQMLGF